MKTFKELKILKRPHITAIVILSLIWLLLPQDAAHALDRWRVLPIRSEEEFNLGMIGGEAEQYPHSIARCRNHPEIIYISHDCRQAWRSDDGGETWEHVLGKGLYLNMGQSIEVDPVNPDIVFLTVDDAWNHLNRDSQGLYRSTDGGQNWQFILPLSLAHNSPKMDQHTIDYDPNSIQDGKAMRWYVATNAPTPGQGLYRSDDGGDTWTASLGLEQEIKSNVSTEGNDNANWPSANIFNNIYTDNSVLSLPGFKIIYNFSEPKILDRIELYQGDWENNYNYAKELRIDFDDGTSSAVTLQELPSQKQIINLESKQVEEMTITVVSIYENPNAPNSTMGGFKEIEVFDNTGEDITIWSEGINVVYDIECHPTDGKTVYAATDAGLYRSTTMGNNMTPCGGILSTADVTSIEINANEPNKIYAVIREEGLYYSENGGDTFSKISSSEELAPDPLKVFLNPGYPNVVFLVDKNRAALVSENAGVTWKTTVTEPVPGLGRAGSGWKSKIAGEITGIVPNPTNANEAVASSRSTLWKATNVIDGNPAIFKDSSTLFTGYAWGWWNDGIAFDRYDPKRFATFNADVGMAITHNAGNFFERRNDQAGQWRQEGLIQWLSTCSGDFQPIPGSQVMVAAIGSGWVKQLMRTIDEGRTWELVTRESEYNLFIAFHPDYPNIVYAGNKISTDAGASFNPVDFGTYGNASILGICDPDPNTPDDIYIFAIDGNKRILRSHDKLAGDWELIVEASDWYFKKLDSKPTFAVHPTNPNIVYTIDRDGDLAEYDHSTNTWHSFEVLQKSGTGFGNFVRSVAIDPNHPEIIYAGMFAAGLNHIWRSTDGGRTWIDISYNLPRTGIQSLAVNPHTGELLMGSTFGTWVLPPPYESDTVIYDKSILYNGSVPSQGDVSGNGEITSYDASLAAQHSVGLITLDEDAVHRADVTRNNELSSYDASLIAQYVIGLINGF